MKKLLIIPTVLFLWSRSSPRAITPPQKMGRAFAKPLELRETEIIKLESSPEGKYPIYISSFQVIDGRLYILDGVISQQAFIYDLKGKLIQTVGRVGSGPGEYRRPGGFTFDGEHMYIVNAYKQAINKYDRNGTFIKEFVAPSDGIGYHIFPAQNNNLYFTAYSRYALEGSIKILDSEGQVLKAFSPPDSDFINAFDIYQPGDLVIEKDRMLQFFNHRYQVLAFDLAGGEPEVIQLASSNYVVPNYRKAKTISGHRAELNFAGTFTHFSAFAKMETGYVTQLRRYSKGMKSNRQLLEFWDPEFWGKGYYKVPEEDEFVGCDGDRLMFTRETETGFDLVFMELKQEPELLASAKKNNLDSNSNH